MSDLNQEFLNEYIRLEKLCKDLYKDLPREELKGVWNYTQDMKNTPMHISRKIPDWYFHFEEFERLRKTRNKREHKEDGRKNYPITQEDIEYLMDFRQSILEQTDPISQARKTIQKANSAPQKSAPIVNARSAANIPRTIPDLTSLFLFLLRIVAAEELLFLIFSSVIFIFPLYVIFSELSP